MKFHHKHSNILSWAFQSYIFMLDIILETTWNPVLVKESQEITAWT